MEKRFTPKQVSLAIGVSESSIKRWCDKGSITANYSTGGHRRISTSGLLNFIRGSRYVLANPVAIGLPERFPIEEMPRDELLNRIVDSLVSGNEIAMRQLAIELFLAGNRIDKICDDFIAPAFAKVGELWQCHSIEVFQERLACEMSQRILNEIRTLIPVPTEGSPVAIGASPQGDFYSLPSMMVELTFRDCGWQSTSMGENVPLASLATAIQTYSPKIFWISASHLESKERFITEFTQLHNQFGGSVSFIIGGRALNEEVLTRLPKVLYCQNQCQLMQHLGTIS